MADFGRSGSVTYILLSIIPWRQEAIMESSMPANRGAALALSFSS